MENRNQINHQCELLSMFVVFSWYAYVNSPFASRQQVKMAPNGRFILVLQIIRKYVFFIYISLWHKSILLTRWWSVKKRNLWTLIICRSQASRDAYVFFFVINRMNKSKHGADRVIIGISLLSWVQILSSLSSSHKQLLSNTSAQSFGGVLCIYTYNNIYSGGQMK